MSFDGSPDMFFLSFSLSLSLRAKSLQSILWPAGGKSVLRDVFSHPPQSKMGGVLSVCHKLPGFLLLVSLHQSLFSILTPRQTHHSINHCIPKRTPNELVHCMMVGVECHLQGCFGVTARLLSSFSSRERKKWMKPKYFSALLEKKGFIVKGNMMSNPGQKIVSQKKCIPDSDLMASTDCAEGIMDIYSWGNSPSPWCLSLTINNNNRLVLHHLPNHKNIRSPECRKLMFYAPQL